MSSRDNTEARTIDFKSHLDGVMDTVGEGVIIIDSSGRIIMVNREFEEIWGYTRDEVLGKGLTELMPEKYREAHKSGLERYIQTKKAVILGKRRELEGLKKDGTVFPLEIRITETASNGDLYFTAALRDITQRRKAVRQLHNEARLRKQNEVLLTLAKSEALEHGDLNQLLRLITESVTKTLRVARANVWLYNTDHTKIHCIEHYESETGEHSKGIEISAADYPTYFKALENERIIAAHDAHRDERTFEFSESYLQPLGINSMLDAPIRHRGRMIGLICNEHTGPARTWTLDEQNFAGSIADFISLAMEARGRKRAEVSLRETLDQLSRKNRYETIIGAVTRSVHRSTNLDTVLENAVQSIFENIEKADSVAIYFVEGHEAVLKAQRGYSDWYLAKVGRIKYPKGYAWKVIIDEEARYCSDVDEDTVIGPAGREFGIKSYLALPISYAEKTIGTININSFRKSAFDEEEVRLLEIVRDQISVALGNARQKGALQEAMSEVEVLRKSLMTKGIYTPAKIDAEKYLEDIIGQSAVMKKAIFMTEHAASTDSPIVIWGESGTGKNLFARTIHYLSQRSGYPFVDIDCEGQDENAIEIRMFGFEERGSKSNALSFSLGSMELADKGTVYLKNINKLPMRMQDSLLGVLQEREFKRTGSTRRINVDLRIIAGTRDDLERDVDSGMFMEDLFHELRGSQIKLPPLKERIEDIPLLTLRLAKKHGMRSGREITTVSQDVYDYFQLYNWPGNIRELERMVERMVASSAGPVLELTRDTMSLLAARDASETGIS